MKRTTRTYINISKLRIKRQQSDNEKESSNIIPKAHRTQTQTHTIKKTSIEEFISTVADNNIENTSFSDQQDLPLIDPFFSNQQDQYWTDEK
ncbi:9889_t:CDS:1, partial [Acaulospora morrowiae]